MHFLGSRPICALMKWQGRTSEIRVSVNMGVQYTSVHMHFEVVFPHFNAISTGARFNRFLYTYEAVFNERLW